MKILLKSIAIASLFFISCKKEPVSVVAPTKAKSTTLDAVVGSLTQSAPNSPVTPASLQPKATEATPNSIMRTVKYTAVPTPATPVPVVKGMNPAHGQPGHRCDIAVGAPLNSPPGKAPVATQPAKPVTIATPVANNVPELLKAPATATTPVVTAAGMNPPHGQEGHRCDITVGAPLPK